MDGKPEFQFSIASYQVYECFIPYILVGIVCLKTVSNCMEKIWIWIYFNFFGVSEYENVFELIFSVFKFLEII